MKKFIFFVFIVCEIYTNLFPMEGDKKAKIESNEFLLPSLPNETLLNIIEQMLPTEKELTYEIEQLIQNVDDPQLQEKIETDYVLKRYLDVFRSISNLKATHPQFFYLLQDPSFLRLIAKSIKIKNANIAIPLNEIRNKIPHIRWIVILLDQIEEIEKKHKRQQHLNLKLGRAIRSNDIKKVKSLIDQGADTEYVFMNRTSLGLATSLAYYDIVRLLIRNNANINSIGKDKQNALHILASKRVLNQDDLEIAKFFIVHGIDINAQDALGKTPLIIAAEKSHNGLIILLLKQHANGTLRNSKDQTAADIVRTNRSWWLASYIEFGI